MGAVTTITQDKLNEYLKLSGMANLPDKVKATFLELASLHGLNPFKNEIYLLPFDTYNPNTKQKETQYTIITGYQTFIKKANQTGKLSGWKAEILKDGQSIVGAKVTIWRKDWEHPFEWEVDFEEFARKKKDGSFMGNWATMPGFMIRKVAIAQAFRLCFEGEVDMHGLYEEAEVDKMKDEVIDTEIEEKQDIKKEFANYLLNNSIPKQALKQFSNYAKEAGFDLTNDEVKQKLLDDKDSLNRLIENFLDAVMEAEETV